MTDERLRFAETEYGRLAYRVDGGGGAKLMLYPDAGHCFLFRYIEDFAGEVDRFLSAS
jgi:hypothetical protein